LSHIEDAITYSGIAPENMELELTESALMEDAPSAKALMGQLSSMGVRTAIDDFGTGYSSLAYLKEFPLDRIKIDRCFVSDLPQDDNLSIITRSILSLAQGLGLGTIAEGVEKEEQIDFLRNYGCEELQGFLLSKPLSATQLEEFLENHEGHVAAMATVA
jgi:EAL domain-containing protein (putative c-di-GMP-specific phosphodiesterase class I)